VLRDGLVRRARTRHIELINQLQVFALFPVQASIIGLDSVVSGVRDGSPPARCEMRPPAGPCPCSATLLSCVLRV